MDKRMKISVAGVIIGILMMIIGYIPTTCGPPGSFCQIITMNNPLLFLSGLFIFLIFIIILLYLREKGAKNVKKENI